MKKIVIIEKCNKCPYFNSNEHGERCFHPLIVKPHKEGVKPKMIKFTDYHHIKIPKWCPLENAVPNQ